MHWDGGVVAEQSSLPRGLPLQPPVLRPAPSPAWALQLLLQTQLLQLFPGTQDHSTQTGIETDTGVSPSLTYYG